MSERERALVREAFARGRVSGRGAMGADEHERAVSSIVEWADRFHPPSPLVRSERDVAIERAAARVVAEYSGGLRDVIAKMRSGATPRHTGSSLSCLLDLDDALALPTAPAEASRDERARRRAAESESR
jgi:hypothetical protein